MYMEYKRGRKHLIVTSIIFFLLCGIVYFVNDKQFAQGVHGFLEKGTLPIQRAVYGLFPSFFRTTSSLEKLEQENRVLIQKLVDYERIEKENVALRSQFQTVYPQPKVLLPATIVGMKTFIPGISTPDSLLLDKGSEDNVQTGDVAVYENVLIGKVVKVSLHLSLVRLTTKSDELITAKTVKTGALGLIKGQGEGAMVLDNVLLSEKLEVSDVVVSKGDVGLDGKGVPPDLIIGKIASIDRKTSELFQTAKVESLIDVANLSIVFIVR